MADSDIRICEVNVSFSEEVFQGALKLSTGNISTITYALVEVCVVNRNGSEAAGVGGIFLSDLWAFGQALPDTERGLKAKAMRELAESLRTALSEVSDYGDPLQLSFGMERAIESMSARVCEEIGLPLIPELAQRVCWSPFDAAIHDAWGRAAGKSCYAMYNVKHLNEDLSAYLGAGWEGIYPQQFLTNPRSKLQVQHVLGFTDPLYVDDVSAGGNRQPSALEEWMVQDRVTHIKLKTTGVDPQRDGKRIQEVYEAAVAIAESLGMEHDRIRIATDSNNNGHNIAAHIEM
ncbi:hypothetical protein, partial [Peribacillus sp. NPDC056705]|uniref:hypothetical protein n=1 Tax=Peribacillus sp. NPDC056705 TaxID=3345918 RepID=UPI003748CDEF